MDLLGRTWRALPEPVRTRAKAVLASQNIGRLPVRDERLDGIEVILDAPTEMTFEERLFLYALVRGTAPRRVLEIGTSQGGSALIFASAMESNGSGTVVGIDPMPRVEIPDERFKGRFHLVTGESPGAVAEASELAGGLFDLVLIDG